MTLHIGRTLGRYYLSAQLGEGGMATVYKAYDIRLERDVAIKIIRSEQFSSTTFEQFLKRFEREAKALAKLNHPNIIPIIDYGEELDKPYLVMPYLPGGTLAQRLGQPIPWQTAIQLLLPIAHALAYAHQHGTIHRDVKPSNILITESGEPMLTDFGIAKIMESEPTTTLTGAGVGIGTPEYMAPEQGLGKPIDGRADMYSLGVVLYEMVTGRKPYIAETPLAVVLKHLTEPLPPPHAFAPSLPEAMEKAIIKALMKNPNDRYENMEAFIQVLESLLDRARGLAPTQVIAATEISQPTLSSKTPAWEKTQQVSEGVVFLDEGTTLKRAPSPFSLGRITIQRIGIAAAIGILLLLVWLGQINRASGERPTASSVAISMITLTPAAVNTLLPTSNAAPSPTPGPLATATTRMLLPSLEAISPNNVDRLAKLADWGKGRPGEIAYSSDGEFLAVASSIGVYLFAANSLEEVGFLKINAWVDCIAFSPDGKFLAAGSQDNAIRVWQVDDLSLLSKVEGHEGWIQSLAFSPDGTILASASGGHNVFLWKVADGSPIRSLNGQPNWVRSVSFSSDGKTLAAAAGKIVQVWDAAQGSKLFELVGHTDEIEEVAFSPDGSLLATGARDKTIRLWRASDGAPLSTLEQLPGRVTSIAFSPDGSILAAGSNNTLRAWRVSDGKTIDELSQGGLHDVEDIAFSSDGNILASSANDAILIRRVSDGQLLHTIEDFTSFVNSVTFSPQGALLAAGYSNSSMRLWQVSDGKLLRTLSASYSGDQSLAFSPDGAILASGMMNSPIQLWETKNWTPVRTLGETYGGYIRNITFSLKGNILASASSDKTVRLWNVTDGTLLNTLQGHRYPVWGVAFSPDGEMIASSSEDQTVRLWKLDGSLIFTLQGHTSLVWDVAFSPDGALVASGSNDQTIRLWRVSDGSLVRTLEANGRVFCVTFSPDGALLASGSDEATIQLWRVSDGALLRTLSDPTGDVWSLAFSGDGKLLAAGAADGVIRLWGVTP